MSIVQIAKMAGVSHATVSRVINHQPGVSSHNVTRVRQAMKQLKYTPSATRRGRPSKSRPSMRTGNIAFLFVGTDPTQGIAPAAATVLHIVQDELSKLGFNLIVGQLNDLKNKESILPPTVKNGQIDGMLLHGYVPPKQISEHLKAFPCVWLLSQRHTRGYWGDRVAPDNAMIGRLAAEYLIDRGHQHIAFLHAIRSHLGFAVRVDAFREAAQVRGVRAFVVPDDLPDHQNAATNGNGRHREADLDSDALIEQLAQLSPRPTGVFVPTDSRVAACYRSLRARGIEPGTDVEIVSCDNLPVLDGVDPRPASLDIRPDEIAKRAVEQLMWRIENPHAPVTVTSTVEPRLVDPRSAESAST